MAWNVLENMEMFYDELLYRIKLLYKEDGPFDAVVCYDRRAQIQLS